MTDEKGINTGTVHNITSGIGVKLNTTYGAALGNYAYFNGSIITTTLLLIGVFSLIVIMRYEP